MISGLMAQFLWGGISAQRIPTKYKMQIDLFSIGGNAQLRWTNPTLHQAMILGLAAQLL